MAPWLKIRLARWGLIPVLVASVMQPASLEAQRRPDVSREQLEGAVARTVGRWSVPGTSVAIVKDGAIVLARGFGVRAAGRTAAVDENTLFYAASITKSFTATALGLLAAEGRLDVEAAIGSYLPELPQRDGEVGGLTVRDLLAHRTGRARADLLLFAGLADAEVTRRLHRIPLVARPRERFTYQNQMYVTLGELIARRAQMNWSQFIEERLLRPLGMNHSNAGGLGQVPADSNSARPHVMKDGRAAEIEMVPRAPTGAGAINTSALDLARWVQFQLGDGSGPSGRLLPRGVMEAMHTPNMVVGTPLFAPNATLQTYALGWFVQDHDGLRVVQHGGMGEGWSSLVWMVPDLSLGIVVLTNLNDSQLPFAVAHEVTALYAPESVGPWADNFLARERARMQGRQQAAPSGQPMGSRWAGIWRSPIYGDLSVSLEPGGASLSYGVLTATLSALDDDSAALIWGREDLAAVAGAARAEIAGTDGEERLTLEMGGERLEFER